VDYLLGDGFSESVYLICEKYLVYSNTRDGLAVVVLQDPAEGCVKTDEWDEAFADHLAREGIGFGEEGREYARSLIISFALALPERRQRFQKLIESVGSTG